MKISLNWLKDYVDAKLSAEELAHRLTMAGLEVEKIHDAGKDKVFELEITPNRPDCLNMTGIAREVAAITQKPLKMPVIKPCAARGKVDITVTDKKDCGRYIGVIIRDVKVGGSPAWLRERIEALGLRSINNVVDITNFCLLELGQPLHAFDYDKLSGGKIVTRRAKKGEKIVTIDGVERELDESILVIADDRRAVAVAGIMGGKETEVDGATRNVLLESAHFDMTLIRRACRRLGLTSDSAYRFERGVDWGTIEQGSNRAVTLILESAGGVVVGRADVKSGKTTAARKAISVTIDEINGLLGADITAAKCKTILTQLGCAVKGTKNILKVTPPSTRGDLKQSVDFAEEVGRIIGYDNLPMSLPAVPAENIVVDTQLLRIKKILRASLLAQGLDEAVTFAMVSRRDLEKTALGNSPAVKVFNPLTQEQEFMRPDLLPGLLKVVAGNINRGIKDVRFFELGKIYTVSGETDTLGMVLCGKRTGDWRAGKRETVDFYDIKGAVEGVLAALKVSEVTFEPVNPGYGEAGLCAKVRRDSQEIGVIGRVASGVLSQWDVKSSEVYFASIDVAALAKLVKPAGKYQPVSEFPAIVRDVSLAVKKDIPYQKIVDTCRRLGGEILKDVSFIEQYVGEKIQPGHRGLVFSLVYQSVAKTLREDEVNAIHERICQALTQELGAARR